MNIKNIRVDSRGLHGQVAVSWIPNLGINRVVIVDDEIVKDQMQKQILKMAKPSNIKLSIISTNRFKTRLEEKNAYENENVLVLFTRFVTLNELFNYTDILNEINLANISNKPGYTKIKNTVYLNKDEIEIAKELQQKGVEFYHQMTFDKTKEEIKF